MFATKISIGEGQYPIIFVETFVIHVVGIDVGRVTVVVLSPLIETCFWIVEVGWPAPRKLIQLL